MPNLCPYKFNYDHAISSQDVKAVLLQFGMSAQNDERKQFVKISKSSLNWKSHFHLCVVHRSRRKVTFQADTYDWLGTSKPNFYENCDKSLAKS